MAHSHNKFRVCMVAPFPPRKGGVTVQTALLAKYLVQSGVKLVRVDTNLQGLRRRGLGPLRIVLQPWVVLWRMLCSFGKCDVVHFESASFWAFMPAFLGVPLARLFRKRTVVSYHGGMGPEFIDRWGWFARMPMRKCTVLTVCSDKLLAGFEARGIRPELHRNLFEAERFVYRDRCEVEPKICWTRSMEEIYDPLTAVKALEIVRQRHPGAVLTMAGDGPLQQPVVDYVAEHKIEGISLVGRLSSEGVAELMLESSICLNTSTIDGLPTALLEAAATGLPIITTKAGGIEYLFRRDESALFVEMGDAGGMAAAICSVIEDPGKARALGAAARAVALNYSWPEVKGDYVRFYGMSDGDL